VCCQVDGTHTTLAEKLFEAVLVIEDLPNVLIK
jgi:hypothetical protein